MSDNDPWWFIEARKHPGCWITVLKDEKRIVASVLPEDARAAVPPGTTRFIFWQPHLEDEDVIQVGL